MSKQETTTKKRKDIILGELIEQAGGIRFINNKVKEISDLKAYDRYRLKLQLIDVLDAYIVSKNGTKQENEDATVLTFTQYYEREMAKITDNPPSFAVAAESLKNDVKNSISLQFRGLIYEYKDYLYKMKLEGNLSHKKEKELFDELRERYL